MFNQYPYTDFHELNLDWVIAQIRQLHTSYDEFKAVNQITNAGAWDITKDYASWTIVSDHNKGYISLKPVPAGVPITNTEYWGFVGDYSLVVTELTARVAALEQAVFVAKAKKVLFLGDSYQFHGAGWVDGVAVGLRLSEDEYFNYCVSGHGFYDGQIPESWVTDLNRFISEHPGELLQIKDVIIVGGINDTNTDQSVLATTINTFFDIVKANMPNALVSMAWVGNAMADSPVLSGRTSAKRQSCMNAEKKAFATNGGRYLTGTENILYQYTLFEADGLHPNQYGIERIITYVVQALLTGYADVASLGQLSLGTESVPNGTAYEMLSGGVYTVDLRVVKTLNNVTISNGYVEIVNSAVDLNKISARNTENVITNLEKRTASGMTLIPVRLKFTNGKLMATAAYAASTGSYPSSVTNDSTYLTHVRFTAMPQNML